MATPGTWHSEAAWKTCHACQHGALGVQGFRAARHSSSPAQPRLASCRMHLADGVQRAAVGERPLQRALQLQPRLDRIRRVCLPHVRRGAAALHPDTLLTQQAGCRAWQHRRACSRNLSGQDTGCQRGVQVTARETRADAADATRLCQSGGGGASMLASGCVSAAALPSRLWVQQALSAHTSPRFLVCLEHGMLAQWNAVSRTCTLNMGFRSPMAGALL